MEDAYFSKFFEVLKKRYPNKEDHTVEAFLATFASVPPSFKKLEKCDIKAEAFRRDGNALFASGDYEEAAMTYTRCIQNAFPFSECAAMAYADRSAALYKLKAYEECVSDIERALDLPYPDISLREKLTTRKKTALTSFNKVKANGKRSEKTPVADDLEFPYGENPEIPDASEGIEIRFGTGYGRKLFAKMPFEAGDVLVIENPSVKILPIDNDPICCNYCFKISFCLIPCDQCTHAVYCSEKCRTKAYENYHRIECVVQFTLLSAIIPSSRYSIFYDLRCLNIFTGQGTDLDPICDDIKEIEQRSNPAKLGFTGEKFIGSTRKAFLSATCGKKMNEDSTVLFYACYIVILLRNFTNFFKTNTDMPLVAKLLLTLRVAYFVNHIPMPYLGNRKIKRAGTYPLIRLTSHRCFSNTIGYYDTNDRFILRASEDIKPGEQILFNYCSLAYITPNLSNNPVGFYDTGIIVCKECDIIFLITEDLQLFRIKNDKELCLRLKKNPYDSAGFWKLLNLSDNERDGQSVSLKRELIKLLLQNAYEKRNDSMNIKLLGFLGVN